LVCIGIIIMRKASPDVPRPFRTPLVPLVPILGAVVCTLMILSLNTTTLMSAMGWMVVGVLIYFTYSIRHSKVSN
jgi:APA family basic amino acid/polyamine antiporter